MRTNPSNYYELLSFGLGNGSHAFQTFVDKFKLKYNTPQTDGFVWDSEIQLDYTYEQLIASLNVATLPIYVDAESEALDKSLGQYQVATNKIPTQKHRYGLNTKMLREKMIMVQRYGEAALNASAKESLLNLLFDSTDKLIAGNRNALTHQRMQIVSTGQFVINAANNSRGIQGITFNFGIGTESANAGNARWWTNATHSVANEGSTADPIEDLKTVIRAKKRLGYPALQIEMSRDLYDDMLTHSAVLKRIGYASLLSAASDNAAISYATNMTDDAKVNIIERLVGAPIIARDTLAMQETFDTTTNTIKPVAVENFKKENVAFVPQGQIGTIKATQPMVFAEDPTMRTAWFDGGRTLITQRFDSKTRSCYVESEMAALIVPNMPQYMCVKTVTV